MKTKLATTKIDHAFAVEKERKTRTKTLCYSLDLACRFWCTS